MACNPDKKGGLFSRPKLRVKDLNLRPLGYEEISNLPVFDKEVIRIRFAFVRSRRSTVARFIQYKQPWKLGQLGLL